MSAENKTSKALASSLLSGRRTIARDIVISFVLTVSLISFLTISWNFLILSRKADRQNHARADEYIDYLKTSLELPLWNVDREGVHKIGNAFTQNVLVDRLVIKDGMGETWFESSSNETDLIEAAADVTYEGQAIGTVAIGLTSRIYKENNLRLLKSWLINLVIVVLVLIAVAGVVLRTFLMKPLEDLNSRIDRIAEGDYGYSPQSYHHRDMETILAKFNHMAEKVKRREGTLNEINAQLRQEIDDRKAIQNELQENKELYSKLIATIPDFLVRTDINGQIQFINDVALQTSGYSPEEVAGKNMLEFIVPAEREKAVENTLHMLEGQLGPKEYTLVMKDGRQLQFEVNGDVLRDNNGNPSGMVYVCRDITERLRFAEDRQRMEEQLHRAQKMEVIGTLAGGVAHDLNNILSGLVSYPDLILMDLPQDSPFRKPMMTIKGSGEKAAVIVQDLLTLARRGVAVTETVNLNDTILQYLASPEHEKLIRYHADVRVTTDLDADLLPILGSPVHLSKTIMNLVSNASESMPGGGTIAISTENRYIDRPVRGYDEVKEGDYAVVEITDTGIGIKSEDIGRIFEPFYTKKVMGRSGTGLGMAVVWGTVKDHHGYIDVQSLEGQGTTVVLYFPVARRTKKEKAAARHEDLSGNGEAVLVIDDVKEQREIATYMLQKLGYDVTTVASGEAAIEYLADHTTDLLVLDMIMEPGMDGLDTYRGVLQRHPKQKAVIVSGYSETERVKEAQRLGAGAYIKKPYVMEKLGAAIKAELKKE